MCHHHRCQVHWMCAVNQRWNTMKRALKAWWHGLWCVPWDVWRAQRRPETSVESWGFSSQKSGWNLACATCQMPRTWTRRGSSPYSLVNMNSQMTMILHVAQRARCAMMRKNSTSTAKPRHIGAYSGCLSWTRWSRSWTCFTLSTMNLLCLPLHKGIQAVTLRWPRRAEKKDCFDTSSQISAKWVTLMIWQRCATAPDQQEPMEESTEQKFWEAQAPIEVFQVMRHEISCPATVPQLAQGPNKSKVTSSDGFGLTLRDSCDIAAKLHIKAGCK